LERALSNLTERDEAEAVEVAVTFRLLLPALSGGLSSSGASKSEPLLDAASCGSDERDGRDDAVLVATEDFLASCLERFVAGMIWVTGS
jgi:hypothetical protein